MSPVPEEAYESFDLNVYSLGKPSGTITRTDRDPKDKEYWSSTAVSLFACCLILLLTSCRFNITPVHMMTVPICGWEA